MRTKVIEKTVYQFSELSDEAKERALQDYAQFIGETGDAAEFVIEDAKNIGALMGITVNNVYYSGFWSQGDGACFEGSYEYTKGSVKAVESEAPQDKELHRIAQGLREVQARNFYALSASVRQRGHYNNSSNTEITVDDSRHWRASDDAIETVKELLRDYMDWIYRNLEREYEYQTSEEQCREASEANQWEYDESGRLA